MNTLKAILIVTLALIPSYAYSGPTMGELAGETCGEARQHFSQKNYGLLLESPSGMRCYTYILSFIDGAIYVDELRGGGKLSQCKEDIKAINVMRSFFHLYENSESLDEEPASIHLGASLYFECDKSLGVFDQYNKSEGQ